MARSCSAAAAAAAAGRQRGGARAGVQALLLLLHAWMKVSLLLSSLDCSACAPLTTNAMLHQTSTFFIVAPHFAVQVSYLTCAPQ